MVCGKFVENESAEKSSQNKLIAKKNSKQKPSILKTLKVNHSKQFRH